MPSPSILFLSVACLLWLSVFGYVALLLALTVPRGGRRLRAQSRRRLPDSDLPRVAVVVPVRNEERFIQDKLDDLRRSDYPAHLLTITVVDGASTDATAQLVEAECQRDAALRLVRVEGAAGKADQLNAVLPGLGEDILVVTDADAQLDPGCIRALVEELSSSADTDVLGAHVRPATRLLEERIHWWVLNSLWWLEGEAFGGGQVSGVCYAIRRRAVLPLPSDSTAEDILFGLHASSRGRAVRLCREALAVEKRVPRTIRELVTFRRRRGSGYLRELRRMSTAHAPPRWRLVQALRLYHFFVMPVLAALTAAGSLALLVTPQWPLSLAVGLAFAMPAALALSASSTLGAVGRSGQGPRWWHLSLAAGRLAGLTCFSLLALPRATATPPPKGD